MDSFQNMKNICLKFNILNIICNARKDFYCSRNPPKDDAEYQMKCFWHRWNDHGDNKNLTELMTQRIY